MSPFCTKLMRAPGGTSDEAILDLATMLSFPNEKAECTKPGDNKRKKKNRGETKGEGKASRWAKRARDRARGSQFSNEEAGAKTHT